MTIHVEVTPGICNLVAQITAEADDAFDVELQIESDCKQIQQLAERLQKIATLQELRRPINETEVYQAAAGAKLHVSCPVPSAILKAVEAAAGMALPADVQVRIRRT